jgi:hypothetical protein
MVCGEEFGKNAMKQLKFTRRSYEPVIDQTAGIDIVFDTFKQERMLANFTELHQFISKACECITFADVEVNKNSR